MPMKKRAPIPTSSSASALAAAGSSSAPLLRSRRWLCLQLVLVCSVILSALALLQINSSPSPPSTSTAAAVAAAAAAAAAVREQVFFDGPPKVAFLFLARTNLPLDFLWHTFFKNAQEEKYSIYIHSEPGFVFDKSTTRSPYFYGRQIENRIKVAWGEPTMIQAERLLLAEALQDPANQRFSLISDSCVPLYNFSYTYNYLMSSSKSFVDSFIYKKEGRYNPKMSPIIPQDNWRKGSQWITLVRKHAEVIVADIVIFPIFKNLCKPRKETDATGKTKNKAAAQKETNCIPDEHYVQTLLTMSGLDDELERRTLTYSLWNQSTNGEDKRSWHPVTFKFRDARRENIMKIRNIEHVYYETEYRTEWCQCNATLVPCFLFARKFSQPAAMRLLNEGLIGQIDATLFTSSRS